MCGISGFSGLAKEHRSDVIYKMAKVIEYRGPDALNFYYGNNMTFGHNRLSIIDIKMGHQPMQSIDARYTLVFNGEIYNYLELRQFLLAKGHPLKTYSDTEVLLYAYLEYGIDLLKYLNGMFAFAIYDNQEDTLFIARDHFGIKPMYYTEVGGQFVFASEIKSILQHPDIQPIPNTNSLMEYLTFQLQLGRETFFEDIYQLEPAHYMIVEQGRIKEIKRYWDIDYTVNESKSSDQFADELLVLLEHSCSIQMRSDVPVGAYLSGGLDSSSVSVLASNNYYGRLKTFTGGFHDSPIYDESKYARIVSDSINSEHFEIYPTANDFAENFNSIVYHMDQPGGGPGIFPQYMVSRLASEHVKVVLGGQGGDEIFGGYSRYAVAYLEQCLKGAIFETQEEGKHIVTLHSIIDNLPSLKEYVPMIKQQFSTGFFEDMDKRYFNLLDRSPTLSNLYTDGFIKSRDETRLFEKFASIFHHADTFSYLNKMTYFDTKVLLPTLLQIEDRMSMAVSLESRVPLLDFRIVQLAASMPPNMKFAGGKTKAMLLESVKNILPQQIVNRKDKMGFPVPFNEWLRGPLKSYFMDTFTSKACKERGIFNHEGVERQILENGKFNRDLWGALNIELWFSKFID